MPRAKVAGPKRRDGEESSKGSYRSILKALFFSHYDEDTKQTTPFQREEMVATAAKLKVKLPLNKGDAIYNLRYRSKMPEEIVRLAPDGCEWFLDSAGRSKYQFKLIRGSSRIVPRNDSVAIKVPDATPEIISAYAQSDEQALLARVRYNRLIDTFLGVTAYSLQNHLRTQVNGVQVEIDEIYVAVNCKGEQFVIPVQAKGGSDKLSKIQTRQDLACCRQKFPNLTCRPVSTQFMTDGVIVMFALAQDGEEVGVADEKHYRLVAASEISKEDLEQYRR